MIEVNFGIDSADIDDSFVLYARKHKLKNFTNAKNVKRFQDVKRNYMTDKNILKAFIIGAVPNGTRYKRRVFNLVDAMKSIGALMKII